MTRSVVVSLILVALLAAAGSPSRSAAKDEEADSGDAAPLDATGTYLQPNIELPDGAPGYVHVTEGDMPWRIEIGVPREPPRDASRTRARDAAIEAIRMWEAAIQPRVPWFRLEFAEKNPTAAVRVEWKRRIVGPYAGFGRIRAAPGNGVLRVGGSMEISTRPAPLEPALLLDEVRYMVAHEFGHVLGLGHCLDCDSAMNYSWHTRDRVFVTETDVRTFLALLERPNGSRADAAPAAGADRPR